MKKFDFIKMHGLGNDFVIIDERHTRIELTHDEIISVANRHTGIGCDQLITINNDLESNLFIRFLTPMERRFQLVEMVQDVLLDFLWKRITTQQ